MSSTTVQGLTDGTYKYGFETAIETDAAPPGLNEDIIRLISSKKREPAWLLDWRLRAYRHTGAWLTVNTPKDLRRAEEYLAAHPTFRAAEA